MKSCSSLHWIGLILFGILLMPLNAQCQETICGTLVDTVQKGETTYEKSPLLDTLLQRTIKANKENPTIPGYRIQIHYGSNREEAKKVERAFEEAYPNYNADLIYEQPYFKIRIGQFRSKIEAHKLYYRLKKNFSAAFIVPDEIELPKL